MRDVHLRKTLPSLTLFTPTLSRPRALNLFGPAIAFLLLIKVYALYLAGERAEGATAYVTLEPRLRVPQLT